MKANHAADRETELESVDTEKRNTEEAIDKASKKINDYRAEVQRKERERDDIDTNLRRLADNLAFLDLGQQIEDNEAHLVQLEDELNKIPNWENCTSDLQRCEKRKNKLLQDKAKEEGGLSTLKRQIKELEGRLREPKFKNVDEQTRHKRVEVETTLLAVQDLDRCVRATRPTIDATFSLAHLCQSPVPMLTHTTCHTGTT